ncbi:unnamed protein product [Debaryomyces tyrocola]|nr:unnamed protein product [Debaryomyces tyrocola]
MSIEWNVIIYDKPGTDRTAVRPTHVANIPETVNKGIVTSVGAIYQDVQKTKFAGSAFHIIADSKEEIIEFLKKDIYYEKGIWDIDSVIAHPIGVACRLPKTMNGVTIDFANL